MNPARLRDLLQQVGGGSLSVDEALEQLKTLPFEDLGFAKLDHHRSLRLGLPSRRSQQAGRQWLFADRGDARCARTGPQRHDLG